MANVPAWATTPRLGIGALSTGNSALDGTGTLVSVLSAGASGTKIERLIVKALGTTTLGMVRWFINNGAGQHRLFKEVAVTANTASSSNPTFEGLVDLSGPDGTLVLPAGYSLEASTEKTENFVAIAVGGDL